MIDPRDRLLDVALEEELGGLRPPDLTDRLLGRLRRPARLRRLAAIWIGSAAAALVVLGFWLADRPARPAPTPKLPAGLTADQRATIDAWLTDQATKGLGPGGGMDIARIKQVKQGRDELLEFLARYPAGWPHIAPLIERRLATEKNKEVERRLLEILVRSPDPAGNAVLRERLQSQPYMLDPFALLRLAERGVPGVRDALARDLAAGGRAAYMAPAAAWFAREGDRRGAALLDWYDRTRPTLGAPPFTEFAAAVGLHHLGKPAPWRRLAQRVAGEVSTALGAADLATARRKTLELAYFHRALAPGSAVPLSYLPFEVSRYVASEVPSLPDEARIRARLALLTQ